jgi:TolA-binding protein
MSHEAPPRLKSTPGAPRELTQALEALGQSHADRARIARVEQKLGALLDPLPPVSPTAGLRRLSFPSATAGKLIATALFAAVGAGWLLHSRSTASPDVTAARVEVPAERTVEKAESAQVEGGEEPKPPHEERIEAHEQAAIDPAAQVPRAKPTARPAPASRVRTQAPARAQAGHDARAHDEQRVEVERTTEPAASESPPAAAVAREEPESVQRPPEEPPAPPPAPAREADLLLSARMALRTNPSGALDLLDQHVARFPNGMLTPEREVLAIEALRKLGRRADADQRLQRFRAQYPDSPHLRALR